MTPDDHTAPTILASNIRQKSEQLISLAKTRPRVSAVQSASDLAAGLDSKIWNREREAQLKLFRFAREFKNAVNQYGSLAQFPQELFDKLSSMISFESLSDEALKYALGFIVLNARTESEYVMDERGRFPFNLVLYIALQRSGISYQELHQNNRAQSRLIGLVGDHYAMENLMRTIHGENHPLADADQYYSRQIQVKISQDSGKQNQFEKEFTDLLKLFRSRPILFPDIAEKYYGNDGSSQIIVLDRFKSQFEEEFYLSPAKYIEGLTELLRDDLILSPDRLETIADFYDQTQNMPHCPGEDRGKVRRFQLEDGRWVYAKRVALLRVRHPAEEIRKAIQVDEALRELRPQYRAQEFIGVVYDQGNFYLLSLGVLAERTVLDLEQKPPELARIEQILRDAGVGHPEGLIRWKQMLVQDDGGIRIIDFETLPSPRELAMNRPDSVRQEQDIIREQERAYADFPGKPEKTGQEGSGGTEFITALFLATGAAIALLASHQAGAAELSRGVLGLFGSSNMIWGAVLGTFALLGIKEIFFQVELLDEATIVHETAHILFPEADHEVIEAMGLVRTKEVFFDQHRGLLPLVLGKFWRWEIARRAWKLGEETGDPLNRWQYLRLLAEGKTIEEATDKIFNLDRSGRDRTPDSDGAAHFDAKSRSDLSYSSEEMTQVNTLLKGSPINITVTDGELSLAQSKEKTALYKILEIQEGTKEEKQFLAQWAAVIKARVQELCGQGLELETETLPDGAYIFYFGDEENDKEGYDFSTPYGNHVGDMKFFVSLKHLMNIPKAHRQADFMFGTSHEAIHEISGRGDEIHKYLTPQDARILRTGKIGNVQVIENADIFSQVFLKTIDPESPIKKHLDVTLPDVIPIHKYSHSLSGGKSVSVLFSKELLIEDVVHTYAIRVVGSSVEIYRGNIIIVQGVLDEIIKVKDEIDQNLFELSVRRNENRSFQAEVQNLSKNDLMLSQAPTELAIEKKADQSVQANTVQPKKIMNGLKLIVRSFLKRIDKGKYDILGSKAFLMLLFSVASLIDPHAGGLFFILSVASIILNNSFFSSKIEKWGLPIEVNRIELLKYYVRWCTSALSNVSFYILLTAAETHPVWVIALIFWAVVEPILWNLRPRALQQVDSQEIPGTIAQALNIAKQSVAKVTVKSLKKYLNSFNGDVEVWINPKMSLDIYAYRDNDGKFIVIVNDERHLSLLDVRGSLALIALCYEKGSVWLETRYRFLHEALNERKSASEVYRYLESCIPEGFVEIKDAHVSRTGGIRRAIENLQTDRWAKFPSGGASKNIAGGFIVIDVIKERPGWDIRIRAGGQFHMALGYNHSEGDLGYQTLYSGRSVSGHVRCQEDPLVTLYEDPESVDTIVFVMKDWFVENFPREGILMAHAAEKYSPGWRFISELEDELNHGKEGDVIIENIGDAENKDVNEVIWWTIGEGPREIVEVEVDEREIHQYLIPKSKTEGEKVEPWQTQVAKDQAVTFTSDQLSRFTQILGKAKYNVFRHSRGSGNPGPYERQVTVDSSSEPGMTGNNLDSGLRQNDDRDDGLEDKEFRCRFSFGILKGKDLVYERKDTKAYVHVGLSDGRGILTTPQARIWIGENFLKWLLDHGPELLEKILDHELKHLDNSDYSHDEDDGYSDLLREVEQAFHETRVLVPSKWGRQHELPLGIVDGKEKEKEKEKGVRKIHIREINKSTAIKEAFPGRKFTEKQERVLIWLYGLGVRKLAHVVKVFPGIFNYSIEDNLQPTVEYLQGLGSKKIAHIIEVAPSVLGLSIKDNLGPTVQYLRSLGVENIGHVIDVFPKVFTYDLKKNLKPTVEYLQSLHVKRLAHMIETVPSVLGLNLGKRLKPRIRYLRSLRVEKIGHVIDVFPQALNLSMKKIKSRIRYLRKVGVKRMGHVIETLPQVLGLDISENLEPTVQYLQKIGVKRIGDVIDLFPKVLSYSVKENLEPTVEYLESLGVNVAQIIEIFPAVLGYSLEDKLKPTVALLNRIRKDSVVEIRELQDLLMKNPELIKMILDVTEEATQAVHDVKGVIAIYRKLDGEVMHRHHQSAAQWLKSAKDEETLGRIKDELKEIIREISDSLNMNTGSRVELDDQFEAWLKENGILTHAETLKGYVSALRRTLPQILETLGENLEKYRVARGNQLSPDELNQWIQNLSDLIQATRSKDGKVLQNLALELKGIQTLEELGVTDEVKAFGNEMKGRLSKDGLLLDFRTGTYGSIGSALEDRKSIPGGSVLVQKLETRETGIDAIEIRKSEDANLTKGRMARWAFIYAGFKAQLKRLKDAIFKAALKRLESYEIPDKVIFSIDIDFLRDPQKAEKVMFDVAQMRKSQKAGIVFFDTRGDEDFQEFVRKKYRVREDDILVVTGENTGKQLIDQIWRHSFDVLTNKKEQVRVIGFEENWKLYGDYLLTQKIPAVCGDKDFDFEQLLLTVLYSGDEVQLRALMRDQLQLTREEINDLLPKDGKIPPLKTAIHLGRDIDAAARAAGVIEKNM